MTTFLIPLITNLPYVDWKWVCCVTSITLVTVIDLRFVLVLHSFL